MLRASHVCGCHLAAADGATGQMLSAANGAAAARGSVSNYRASNAEKCAELESSSNGGRRTCIVSVRAAGGSAACPRTFMDGLSEPLAAHGT